MKSRGTSFLLLWSNVIIPCGDEQGDWVETPKHLGAAKSLFRFYALFPILNRLHVFYTLPTGASSTRADDDGWADINDEEDYNSTKWIVIYLCLDALLHSG